MQLHCPHCHNPIELVADNSPDEVACPSCGSSFRVAGQSTVSHKPLPTQKLGKFDLLENIGQGGFGTVYKARDPELDRIVAIKVPRAANLADAQDLDRFLREARSVAQLRHPAIVPIHEVGQADGVPYLVSEFVEGMTLAELLSGRQPPPREAAELIALVADGLQAAHDKGVVHRDVKPSNIMIGADGAPHVMDFGLAKRDAGEITMTMDGQVLGTPAYMSPEQARGDAHRVDARSDVYSLGVILYQVLTGELPFRGVTRMLLHQVLHDEPRPPRALNDRIPRDLETICLKAMAKEPRRRYASAAELAADLRRFLKGEPIRARPVGRVEKLWRWSRRNPMVAGLTAAVATILVIGIAVSWYFALLANEAAVQARADKRDADKNAAAEAAQRKQVAAAAGLLESVLQKMQQQEQLTAAEAILQAEFAGEPLIRAKLLHALATSYFAMGEHRKAAKLYQLSFAERKRLLGSNDMLTFQSYLGLLRAQVATLDPMVIATINANDIGLLVAGLTAAVGSDHQDVAKAQAGYAGYLFLQGQTTKAADVYSAIAPKHLKEVEGQTDGLLAQLALARSHIDVGKIANAADMLTKLVGPLGDKFGVKHPVTLRARFWQALAILRNGDAPKGLKAFREVWPAYALLDNKSAEMFELRLEELCDDWQLNAYFPNSPPGPFEGPSMASANEFSFALGETLLAEMQQTLGAHHALTLRLVDTIGRIRFHFATAGRWNDTPSMPMKRAENSDRLVMHYENAAKLMRNKFGPDHEECLRHMSNLGLSYLVVDRPHDARKVFEEVLNRSFAKHGHEHPVAVQARFDLGMTLTRLNRPQDAIPLLTEVLSAYRKSKPQRVTETTLDTDHGLLAGTVSFAHREAGNWTQAFSVDVEFVWAMLDLIQQLRERPIKGGVPDGTPILFSELDKESLLGQTLAVYSRNVPAELLLEFGREFLRRTKYVPLPANATRKDFQIEDIVVFELRHWAKYLLQAGQFDAALAVCEDARRRADLVPGNYYGGGVDLINDLMKLKEKIYDRSGRRGEVVGLIEERLRWLHSREADERFILDLNCDLADAYFKAGDVAKARLLIDAAWQKSKSSRLLQLAEQASLPDRFDTVFADATRQIEQRPGIDNFGFWQELFDCRMRQKRYDDAEMIARKWLTAAGSLKTEGDRYRMEEPLPKPGNVFKPEWYRYVPPMRIGQALLQQAKYTEAEPHLRDGFLAAVRFVDAPRYDSHGQFYFWTQLQDEPARIIRVYEELKRPNDVAEWKKKADEFQQLGDRLKRRFDWERYGMTQRPPMVHRAVQ